MRKIEEYWSDFEKFGFIKHTEGAKTKYTLPEPLGEGYFELWGDTSKAVLTISDFTLKKPLIMNERIEERSMVLGQFHIGQGVFYQKKSEKINFEQGLTYGVNYPFSYGYKRVEANIPFLAIGLLYREAFFETLPYELPQNFWEESARKLNFKNIIIPQITEILSQIKNCNLNDEQLNMYIYAKAMEALTITNHHVFSNPKKESIHLSQKDKMHLQEMKTFLEANYVNPPTIKELATSYTMNEQKLMAGFKFLYHTTVYSYIQKIRINKATELLQDDSLLISEIAKAVGYHGDGHFQQVFKKFYGITPHQMRKDFLKT